MGHKLRESKQWVSRDSVHISYLLLPILLFSISNLHDVNNIKDHNIFRVEGTTAVEIASNLHWYIEYLCGAHVSWDKTGGVHLAFVPPPGSFPHVKKEGIMIN